MMSDSTSNSVESSDPKSGPGKSIEDQEKERETRVLGVLKGWTLLTPNTYRVWAVKTKTTLKSGRVE